MLSKPKFNYLQFGYLALYLFCFLPFFINLPFHPNIYLSWIGSYRISNGEIPFRDFGMPFGIGFWILPSFFFFLFGPYFKILVLTQTVINILSLIVVKNILKEIKLNEYYTFLLVLIFYSTMCMPNYWPWYNHLSVIYQLTSILFLLKALHALQKNKVILYAVLSSFFITLAIFTKQDIGALGLLINLAIIAAYVFFEKKWTVPLIYIIGLAFFFALNILPFLQYQFSYWFNYGQSPHSARVSFHDIFGELISGSEWIKFYLLVIFIILVREKFYISQYQQNKESIILGLLTLGILAQATIIQYTSFNPENGNIYFHVFALAFILKNIDLKIPVQKWQVFMPVMFFVLLWWSFNYNKYINKVLDKVLPPEKHSKEEHVVSKYTWQVSTDTMKFMPMNMTATDIPVLKGVTIPKETLAGIKRLENLEVVKKRGHDLKVLNMSELTFLPYEIGYETLKGENQPLWNHLNVAFFDRELKKFCREIEEKKFDLILFQDVYYSDNYFPYAVRDCAKANYKYVFTMRGPKGFSGNYIHVYVKE